MRSDGHEHVRHQLGAFALGHLAEDEAAAVQAHLDGCAACAEEEAELARVAAMLPLADAARLGATPSPPADLQERVFERIREERERERARLRRARSVRAAFAVAAVLVLWIVLAWPFGSEGERVALAATVPGVSGQAVIHDESSSTWVELTTSGLDAGETYALWLEEQDTGERYRCGTFTATDGDLYISLYSTLTRDEAAAIGVSTLDDDVVMEADLSPSVAD